MNKKLFLLIPAFLLVTGCNQTQQVSSGTSDEPISSESISESESESESEPEENYGTLTIQLIDVGINSGSKVDDASNKEKFIALFDGLLSDCSPSNIFFQKYGGDASRGCFCIGSASTSGSIDLVFNKKVKSIEVMPQNYYNHWSYTTAEGPVEGFSVDTEAEFNIDGTNYNLPVEDANSEPPIGYITHTFDQSTNRFRIGNSDAEHRVYFLEMTITYVIE